MKNQFIKLASVAIALIFSQCELPATQSVDDLQLALNSNAPAMCSCLQSNYPQEEISAAESAALLFMREEEKLARDVYVKMKAKWGLQVFANISRSEQRHMDAILCLINKYNLNDPVGDHANGVFQNITLQALYNSLVAQGTQSKTAALTVGAKIEDLDIYDLMQNTGHVDNQDIQAVFDELARASRNHLRAFTSNLANTQPYHPEFIDQALFDEILAAPHEKGGAICFNNGNDCPGNCNNNCNNPCPNGNNGQQNGNGQNGNGQNGNGHRNRGW